MRIAFISGHTDLTPSEFQQHYQSKIMQAIADGDNFVLGSAPGDDSFSLQFLLENVDKSRIDRRNSPVKH